MLVMGSQYFISTFVITIILNGNREARGQRDERDRPCVLNLHEMLKLFVLQGLSRNNLVWELNTCLKKKIRKF